MLQTRMAPANGLLQRYVWAYGMTTGRIDSRPLVIPLPARPKQLLTFSFANRFDILRSGSAGSIAAPRIAVVGPQSCAQPGLSIFGPVDNFAIHFQPAGFNQLFGLPMTELTDAGFDAHAVVGSEASALDRELGDTSSFAERIQIAERHLMRLAGVQERPDAVAIAANSLFACHGQQSVAAMASRCGVSTRQFERRFLSQVGVPPKLYARIIRFNAAVDHKLHCPGLPWSRIAHEQDYYDQMHLVRDCQSFTGESPSRFLARLGGAPAFHAFYATGDRVRQG
jgi:AraC-like DNA-binding protein